MFWVINGVLSNKPTSQQQRGVTSRECWTESISCSAAFAPYTCLIKFTVSSLDFHYIRHHGDQRKKMIAAK